MYFQKWLEQQEIQPKKQFDKVQNLTQTGKYFADFFSKVSKGEFGKSDVAWNQTIDLTPHKDFHNELKNHTGNFDEHIAKSIPTYREIQIKKGNAIVQTFTGKTASMLDIGGSEGSFSKTVTAMSRGTIQTKILDPNPDMQAFYNKKSQVQGSHYDTRAFHRGWVEDDGTEIPALNAENSTDRFDIIHEAMVFQFINNQRATQIVEAKKLLKPNGLLITEEKLKTTPEEWKANELFKDQNHKNIYYSNEELAQKNKIVGFQQSDKESKAVGMVDNMVTVPQFEALLNRNFKEVWQYWDAGNFKGYAASDDPEVVQRFVKAIGNVYNKYSRVQTPRKVVGTMPHNFTEWLMENKHHHEILVTLLPEPEKLHKMCGKHVRKHYGHKIKTKAADLGFDMDDAALEDFFRSIIGPVEELPEFDINHYHHHL